MKFVWNEQKNESNITKHGFDFTDAHRIFGQPMLIALDDREDYGEERWIGVGLLDNRIVVIVYSEPDEDTIRVISLRKALTQERKHYEHYLQNRLEKD
jgi:uncharacterized DUF497 family protein